MSDNKRPALHESPKPIPHETPKPQLIFHETPKPKLHEPASQGRGTGRLYKIRSKP